MRHGASRPRGYHPSSVGKKLGLACMSQRRKVIPFVLLLNFQGKNVVESFQLQKSSRFLCEALLPRLRAKSMSEPSMCAMCAIILIDDLNSWIFVFSANTAWLFFNDWNQVRNHFLQKFKWPFSRASAELCGWVVAVVTRTTRVAPSFNTVLSKKAGIRFKGWPLMGGIVDLDNSTWSASGVAITD